MASSSAAALIAQRFGGSRVARLAAEQALLSRQASAEQSAASVEHSSAETSPLSSRAIETNPNQRQQHLCTAGDDEALLLTDLLNTAPPAGGQHPLGRWSLRQNPLLEAAEMAPERSSSSSSLGSEPSANALPAGVPAAPYDELSESTAASTAEPSELQADSQSGLDAAEDDTVLTGSPVVCSQRGGGSPGPSTSAAPTAAALAAASLVGEVLEQYRSDEDLQDTRAGVWPHAAKPVAPDPHPAGSAGPEVARGAAPTSQLHALPLPASRLKQAVQQRQWSFAAIPQGTASIPSKGSSGKEEATSGTTKRPSAGAGAASSPRPAFYTRAASPPPRVLSAAPTAPSFAACGGEQAGSAAQRRRQRLDRLAQPRHVIHRRKQQQQGSLAAAQQQGSAPHRLAADPLVNHVVIGSMPAPAAAGDCIAAWRTHGTGAAQSVPVQPGRMKQGRQPGSAASSGQWPQNLGREPDAAEVQRATGAYSEERFQRNLGQLYATLALRQQERRRAANATSAGVEELVCQVRQLGTTDAPGGAAGKFAMLPNRCNLPAGRAAAAAPLEADPPEHHQKQPCIGHKGSYEHGISAQQASAGQQEPDSPGSASENEPAGLAQSPTERLLHCRQRLLQRPQTAVPLGAGSPPKQTQRPTTGSPCRVKSLMQVKGEQDWAIRQLSMQRQPFKASPLPLSTMEPRFQQQAAQEESRQQVALSQRRQQLLAQQQPFGFEEREAERRQRRQMIHGSMLASDGGTSARPHTPPVFRAHPVPVSTTEARYALLVAEMQLQNRSVRGGGMASPPRRPSTSAPHLSLSQHRQRLTTAPPLSERRSSAAATAGSSRFGSLGSSMCGSGANGSAWNLAAAAAAVTAAVGPDYISRAAEAGDVADGSAGVADCMQGADAGDQGPPAEQLPGAARSDCGQQEAERCGAAQQEAAQRVELVAGTSGGRCSTETLQPLRQVPLSPAGEEGPGLNCTETMSQGVAGLPATAHHGLARGGPSWEGSGLGEEEAPLPQRVNHLWPLPAHEAVCAADSGPIALRVGSRGSSADVYGVEGPAGPPAAADIATAAAGLEVPSLCSKGCGADSSPMVGAPQSIASSRQETTGDMSRLYRLSASLCAGDAGIAVPVCILPACRAALELMAAPDMHAATHVNTRGTSSDIVASGYTQQAQQGRGVGAPGKPPRWERRDTPPQHIAARHRQVEAVARREVQQLLAKRGSSILSLMQASE